MAKKRVYEIAKQQGLASGELIEALRSAGVEVRTASSSVEESEALSALGGASADGALKPESSKSGVTAATASRPKAAKGPPTARRRRVVIDSQASRRQPEATPAQPQRGGPRRGKRRAKPLPLEEPAEHAVEEEVSEEPAAIKVNSGSTVKDLAAVLDAPVPEVIKTLMGLGEMASITQTLSDEAIALVADELGRAVEVVHVTDEAEITPEHRDAEKDLRERPPVAAVMGHVDHGKTSLLDAIRQTEVVEHEAGGITQHIGAYQVHHGDKLLTFLDTPGHEAFTAMRARGAKVTDVAVIVVAADDGVKPQTTEAIDHARAASVPIVIAVNKIDKENANPEKVRSELAAKGLNPEEWGGETVYCDVSAKTKQGLDELLDMLILVSDVQELRANPDTEASGTVIESRLDPGRGAVATILVQRGTLRVGEAVVAGAHWARVRAMNDFLGQRLEEAKPGMPVEILGFNTVPSAGEHAWVVANERKARQLAEELATRIRAEEIGRKGVRMRLEDIFERIKEGASQLNLVLKADVAGSLEALEDELAKVPQGEITLNIVHSGVGGVNESDVMLAAATGGVVLAFNVRPLAEARAAAEREGVDIRSYTVIYKLVDELRAAMEGMLAPEIVHEDLGVCEVRQVFRASRVGVIAGCYVTEGKIARNAKVRLVRDGAIVYEGELASLKRFKDDVREVEKGFECGLIIKDFADVKEGDVVEAFLTKQVERQLA